MCLLKLTCLTDFVSLIRFLPDWMVFLFIVVGLFAVIAWKRLDR